VTAVALQEDARILRALRAGDEQAFAELVERYHSALLRIALTYVKSRPVAEEVVQETWLGVLRGLEHFERRSLLRTWIFRILINRAKTRAVREARTVPFSSLLSPAEADAGPSVEPERFVRPGGRGRPGDWALPPRSWEDLPESRLDSKETQAVVATAIQALPPLQAQVIALRDVHGWSADEVCTLLGISDGNQRVLLHRARSKVRAALERHLDSSRHPRAR